MGRIYIGHVVSYGRDVWDKDYEDIVFVGTSYDDCVTNTIIAAQEEFDSCKANEDNCTGSVTATVHTYEDGESEHCAFETLRSWDVPYWGEDEDDEEGEDQDGEDEDW